MFRIIQHNIKASQCVYMYANVHIKAQTFKYKYIEIYIKLHTHENTPSDQAWIRQKTFKISRERKINQILENIFVYSVLNKFTVLLQG